MAENKNSAAGAATPNSAKNAGQIVKACSQSISCEETSLQQLLGHIPAGKDHAISMKALAERLGLNERVTRERIHDARLAGAIIAGDNAGYYVPEGREELYRYFLRARRHCISGLASLKAARRKLRELDGQQEEV